MKQMMHLYDVNHSCRSCCIHGLVTCSELRAVLQACTNDRCHGFGRRAISSRCTGNATGAGSFWLSRGSRNTKSTAHKHNHRTKFKIATMTHTAIYTGNPTYLPDLIQWHTPCRTLRSASANFLSVARCNILFCAWGWVSFSSSCYLE